MVSKEQALETLSYEAVYYWTVFHFLALFSERDGATRIEG